MDKQSLYIVKNISITPKYVRADGKVILDQGENGGFKIFSRDLYKSLHCNYSKFYKMDNLCKLAFLGVELLLKDMEINFPPEKTAIILSNSASTIDSDTNFVNTLDKIPSPAIFVYTLPNIAAGELSIRHGWKGENLFLISDIFNSEETTENLQMLFADSNTEICISGWIDYLSENEYKACLWAITKDQNKNYRKLKPLELSNDFAMN